MKTTLDQPGWVVMWALAVTIYIGCKWLTWRAAEVRDVPAWKHAGYLLAWPGLDASGFLEGRPGVASLKCATREWLTASARLVVGILVLFGVARMIPPQHAYAAGWIGMLGLVLILHFGTFHLMSCWWRSRGVQARPLMNHPLTSTCVGDFWGRRWNTAFRDLTHRFIFRPCGCAFGVRWGIAAGFVFSGLLHELVISVPAGGGYGGPTTFFAIQGVAIVLERSAWGRRIGLGSGRVGRYFACAVLVGPLCLLFHRPFVVGVVVPFMHAIGATS